MQRTIYHLYRIAGTTGVEATDKICAEFDSLSAAAENLKNYIDLTETILSESVTQEEVSAAVRRCIELTNKAISCRDAHPEIFLESIFEESNDDDL
jgi:CBS-domain-containing membrane protein